MGFIIKRTDNGGGYVAPAGSEKSYTKSILRARVYTTYAEADADRCVENEVVVDTSTLLIPCSKGRRS